MPDLLDVIIVGAGLSGIGAACHLRRECPDREFLVLEGRSQSGGTWDLFRYPGIRSDSDMHTLGYRLQTLARGQGHRRRSVYPALRARHGARTRHRERIRYRQQVQTADWDSDAAVLDPWRTRW
jgi:monooxygenase